MQAVRTKHVSLLPLTFHDASDFQRSTKTTFWWTKNNQISKLGADETLKSCLDTMNNIIIIIITITINNIIISHEHEAVHEKKYIINNIVILINHQVLSSHGKTKRLE